MKTFYHIILSVISIFALTACSSTNGKDTETPVGKSPVTHEKFVTPIGIRVDTTKCKTSGIAMSKKQFQQCPYIGVTSLIPDLTVRAVQDFPADEDDNKIYIGQNMDLEFMKNGKRLEIPEQVFHTMWYTEYLGLSVAYIDENHIYVEGTFSSEKPSEGYKYSYLNGGEYDNVYTNFYNGKEWKPLIPQDIVHDPDRLQLFASEKYLKFVNQRGCYYDPNTGVFGENYKDSVLVGTEYIVDASSYQLITKVDKKCST